MQIINPQNPQWLIDQDTGKRVRVRSVNLGAWNMDVTHYIHIDIGIDLQYVLSMNVRIENDAADTWYFIMQMETGDSVYMTGSPIVGTTIVRVWRTVGGTFDNVHFDDGVKNRGSLTIFYTDP